MASLDEVACPLGERRLGSSSLLWGAGAAASLSSIECVNQPKYLQMTRVFNVPQLFRAHVHGIFNYQRVSKRCEVQLGALSGAK